MKKLLQLTDGTCFKDKFVSLLTFIKFDATFALIKTINKLPLSNNLKWKMIVKLRKVAK